MSESGLERDENIPTAPIPLDDYLKKIADFKSLKMYEGIEEDDLDYRFFLRLQRFLPDRSKVDGVDLVDLYEKNVLETGMTPERFREYCHQHELPHRLSANGSPSVHAKAFADLEKQEREENRQAYEDWAGYNGIKVTKPAVMKFVTVDGIFHVRTDFDHCGEILDK